MKYFALCGLLVAGSLCASAAADKLTDSDRRIFCLTVAGINFWNEALFLNAGLLMYRVVVLIAVEINESIFANR